MSRTAVTSLAFGFMVDYSLTASTSSHVASIGSPLRRDKSNITNQAGEIGYIDSPTKEKTIPTPNAACWLRKRRVEIDAPRAHANFPFARETVSPGNRMRPTASSCRLSRRKHSRVKWKSISRLSWYRSEWNNDVELLHQVEQYI